MASMALSITFIASWLSPKFSMLMSSSVKGAAVGAVATTVPTSAAAPARLSRASPAPVASARSEKIS